MGHVMFVGEAQRWITLGQKPLSVLHCRMFVMWDGKSTLVSSSLSSVIAKTDHSGLFCVLPQQKTSIFCLCLLWKNKFLGLLLLLPVVLT